MRSWLHENGRVEGETVSDDGAVTLRVHLRPDKLRELAAYDRSGLVDRIS